MTSVYAKLVALRTTGIRPVSRLFYEGEDGTEVLFNPNAIAVSPRIHDCLARLDGLEFLTISVDGCGDYYIVHAVSAVEPSPEFVTRLGVMGVIQDILSFPRSFVPPSAFFRVHQPVRSVAETNGFCTAELYANDEGARLIRELCVPYLEACLVGGIGPS
jgi:hypothetical protein